MSLSFDRRLVSSALASGALAAVSVELYLFAVGLASWPGVYQFVASGIVGPQAFGAPGYAWLGLGLHAALSLGWALVYATAAARWPVLVRKPLASGAAFGLLVFVCMQAVMAASGIWAAPSPGVLLHYVIDHVLFFGCPLAATFAFSTQRQNAAVLRTLGQRSTRAPLHQ